LASPCSPAAISLKNDTADHPQVLLISRATAQAVFRGMIDWAKAPPRRNQWNRKCRPKSSAWWRVRSEQLTKKDDIDFTAVRAAAKLVSFHRDCGSGRPEMLLGTARAALDRVDRDCRSSSRKPWIR